MQIAADIVSFLSEFVPMLRPFDTVATDTVATVQPS